MVNNLLTPIEILLSRLESPSLKSGSLDEETIYNVSLPAPAGISDSLMACLEELAMNAKEHGSPPYQFNYLLEEDRLTYAIEDNGLGICKKLKDGLKDRLPEKISCGAMLRLVLEEGVSSTNIPGRGQGLNIVNGFVETSNGELYIRTNHGELFKKQVQNSRFEISTYECREHFAGTLVVLSIPI